MSEAKTAAFRPAKCPARPQVIELPEAQPDVAVVALEELIEIHGVDGVRREFLHKVHEQSGIGGALEKRRQPVRIVAGDHDRAGFFRSPLKAPPRPWVELFGTIDQDGVVMVNVLRQARVRSLRGAGRGGVQLDPYNLAHETVGELPEQGGLATSVRADDSAATSFAGEASEKPVPIRPSEPKVKSVDLSARKGIIGGSRSDELVFHRFFGPRERLNLN